MDPNSPLISIPKRPEGQRSTPQAHAAMPSLRSLAEEAGAAFHGNSSRCPLHHGDNPSAFHLYDNDRRWHCFTRCPEDRNDGDIIGFYMAWKKVDYQTAMREVGLRFNVQGLRFKRARAGMAPAREWEMGLRFNVQRLTLKTSRSPAPPSAMPPSREWQARGGGFVDYAASQLRGERGCRARAYLFSERGLRGDCWEAFELGYNPGDLYDDPQRWGFTGGKKIWLPRGIVIPIRFQGKLWSIKVRRPLPGDLLAEYLEAATTLPRVKFGGPRGGRAALFGSELWIGFPILLLAEGELDAMLAWQVAGDLCDVGTLGSATKRPELIDLAGLAQYPLVLAVYDADPAGEAARRQIGSISRVVPVPPPAHDLTDFWRCGGNLRNWIASQVVAQLPRLLDSLAPNCNPALLEEWGSISKAAAGALE